jgi:hypothetical protein
MQNVRARVQLHLAIELDGAIDRGLDRFVVARDAVSSRAVVINVARFAH